jgi:cytochrome c
MAMKFFILCRNQKFRSAKYLFIVSLLFGGVGAVGFAEPAAKEKAESPRSHEGHSAEPGKDPLTAGAAIYKHMCVFCHGEDGNGGGNATAYLYPWPRDFRKGIFKYHTTPVGTIPLDSDIFRTIARGIPGTAMPSWGTALSGDDIYAVVKYIKTFSRRFDEEKPKAPIEIGAPPATANIASGQKIYNEMRCERCHGPDLKGDSPIADQLFDMWDHRVFIYDLTNPNTYKWGYEKKDIYLALTLGVEGTPMKSYGHLTEKDRWDLTAFIQSKIQMDKLEEAHHEVDLHVGKTGKPIDMDPDGQMWNEVPASEVHLMPLSARSDPINRIKVQSLMSDHEIGIRLEWNDATLNQSSSRHEDFKDAVAVEFALGDAILHEHGHNEPFFGMGNRGKVVNIWQWRADWQHEIAIKKKLERATQDMDLDAMIFGGEANPVDSLNPFRGSSVEELNAEGFGTLTPQPMTKQNVDGNGVWKDGKWKVVFKRAIESTNKWDMDFIGNKGPVLIAFAVWDGAHSDRNGRKTISMWQRLNLP